MSPEKERVHTMSELFEEVKFDAATSILAGVMLVLAIAATSLYLLWSDNHFWLAVLIYLLFAALIISIVGRAKKSDFQPDGKTVYIGKACL